MAAVLVLGSNPSLVRPEVVGDLLSGAQWPRKGGGPLAFGVEEVLLRPRAGGAIPEGMQIVHELEVLAPRGFKNIKVESLRVIKMTRTRVGGLSNAVPPTNKN